jgi:hypothetical protein
VNEVDILSKQDVRNASLSLSSSSSLSLSGHYHGVGPLVEPFRSHTSRSLFNGLSWFLVPFGFQFLLINLTNLLTRHSVDISET